MRRFLALGCQEPSLLCCPAEAASPPPLSAFQRSPNNYSVGATTLIPSPNPLSAATTAVDRLFTNIERQLSAKIAFIDPLLLTASGGGGGGGGGDGDANDQQKSPLPVCGEQPQYTTSTNTITQLQEQQKDNNNKEDEQKKQCEEGNTQNQKLEGGPPQKGLDAFFAALSSANDNGQKQEKSPPQNQLICGGPSSTQFSFPQTSAPTTTFPSTDDRHTNTNFVGNNNNNNNNISSNTSLTTNPSKPQNPLVSTQQNLSNAIANAAVNIVNAAIAVQQHQNQQQQQHLAALQFAAQSAASMPLSPQQGLNAQLVEDKVDLMRFKRKEPREWSDDDVIAWILDVARRHRIPCEIF
uniref:PNT domain-containing protein n=1 Tax=Meloidogyne floridensis TaxID=298350 RepID=A0A915NPH0_9BILA